MKESWITEEQIARALRRAVGRGPRRGRASRTVCDRADPVPANRPADGVPDRLVILSCAYGGGAAAVTGVDLVNQDGEGAEPGFVPDLVKDPRPRWAVVMIIFVPGSMNESILSPPRHLLDLPVRGDMQPPLPLFPGFLLVQRLAISGLTPNAVTG